MVFRVEYEFHEILRTKCFVHGNYIIILLWLVSAHSDQYYTMHGVHWNEEGGRGVGKVAYILFIYGEYELKQRLLPSFVRCFFATQYFGYRVAGDSHGYLGWRFCRGRSRHSVDRDKSSCHRWSVACHHGRQLIHNRSVCSSESILIKLTLHMSNIPVNLRYFAGYDWLTSSVQGKTTWSVKRAVMVWRLFGLGRSNSTT